MLENSRASNSRVFIGVLSKFPKLKTSVFRIAEQRFIHWIRVIRSLSNLCLNCNYCISIISRIFWTPANKARKTTLNSLFTSLWAEISWHQFLHRTVRKILRLPNEMNPLMLRKIKTVPNRRNTLRRFRSQERKETRLRWASDVTSY